MLWIQKHQFAIIVPNPFIQSYPIGIPATIACAQFGLEHSAVLDEPHVPRAGAKVAAAMPSKATVGIGETVVKRYRREFMLSPSVGAHGDQVVVPIERNALRRR